MNNYGVDTGLLDRNKNNIYTGDIVFCFEDGIEEYPFDPRFPSANTRNRILRYNTAVVKWAEGDAVRFDIRAANQEVADDWYIVGNIFIDPRIRPTEARND